ncbi:MAG: NAD(P)-dependent alcohol dehydrogenase [Corynebacterium sp.]|uniref:NAD(P)-dependent alcohol dehydrogenase n=1 Tax=unclassified Corynebacterium TaxID=2624378 RepID=UPI00264A2C21|nr:NAD(P)-dependent alcohol dehydrogenase [Corynebacterium sp.]MDN5719334.1 NAD(P)-dependent alcohol dehydrogenase [Corynebacterium sp.]MDN6258247.1 NAD(P)-dependent alcohol dehydrogenase [Corynebacterium sp.]MDN6509178.1 NAD(P)-dependent alcohol dehydrogenase [Corynebacterium sp.]
MTTTAACIEATSAGADLTKGTVTRRDLRADDCLLEIRWSGICHSDIHTVNGDWPHENFPLSPGHEIIGTVLETGADVTKFAVGDIVGIGCMVDSCGECASCADGEENYCLEGLTGTYNGVDRHDGSITQGGYSTHIVCRDDFLIRIPELPGGIDGDTMAAMTPLLCAGITTYSPLKHWGVGPGSRVAVVGMGGLGHVAVKIAVALGAEVTVFSHGLSKKEDGLKFGASSYVATGGDAADTFHKDHADEFDLILNTVSAVLPIHRYISMLAVDGTLVMLGLPPEGMNIRTGQLAGRRRSVAGSNIGGIAETQEMIDFCAEHGITADIELVSADNVNEAYRRVLGSQVRYRAVVDARTI